jgi:hypothetical protein
MFARREASMVLHAACVEAEGVAIANHSSVRRDKKNATDVMRDWQCPF